MANRWAFEALGRSLGLDALTSRVTSLTGYQDAFHGSPAGAWALLAGTAVVLIAATMAVPRSPLPDEVAS